MRVALVVVGLGLAACSPQRSHIFGAQRYDADRDCVGEGSAVDVIEGADPGTCDELRCWVSPADEVYVSTSCDAPPGYSDHSSDPEGSLCARALAAKARPDGGCT